MNEMNNTGEDCNTDDVEEYGNQETDTVDELEVMSKPRGKKVYDYKKRDTDDVEEYGYKQSEAEVRRQVIKESPGDTVTEVTTVTDYLWGRGEPREAVQHLDSLGVSYGDPDYFWSLKVTGEKSVIYDVKKKYLPPKLPPPPQPPSLCVTLTFYNDAPKEEDLRIWIEATKIVLINGRFPSDNPSVEVFVICKDITVKDCSSSPTCKPVMSVQVEATKFLDNKNAEKKAIMSIEDQWSRNYRVVANRVF